MMTDKIIIDGKTIGCPCYIDRPLHRYDKGCLIQSQFFKEQQTEEKPILRCDEIKNCPIKENYKQLQRKTEECEKLKRKLNPKLKNTCCAYFDGQTGLCKAKEFTKCNPVGCKLYTIDELSTIVDLQSELQAEREKAKELENKLKQCWDLHNKFIERADNYKQALDEIKKIASAKEINIETNNAKWLIGWILARCEEILQIIEGVKKNET